jgi:hypothetical protein
VPAVYFHLMDSTDGLRGAEEGEALPQHVAPAGSPSGGSVRTEEVEEKGRKMV